MDNHVELLAALKADIAVRLRPVCADMSAETFEQLVRDIAAVKLKYGLGAEERAALCGKLETLSPESDEPGEKPLGG